MNGISLTLRRGTVAAALLATLAAPLPAHAWWRGGGFGVGLAAGTLFGLAVPALTAPGYYYPPPVYYAPPPVYYAPPPAYAAPGYVAPASGQGCYAGAYVCPLDRPSPVGSPCSCPSNQGRAYGRTG
jgi:hypothetical protein